MNSDLLPLLRRFQPEFLLISAGFDAHKLDRMNRGRGSLLSHDFAAITTMLTDVADECCHGRVVSVLEGGYDEHGLRDGVAAQLRETRERKTKINLCCLLIL